MKMTRHDHSLLVAEKFMEHSYIEEHHILARYLLGKLSAKERTRFEEHFVDCMQCLGRLERTNGFRAGLRTVATEEMSRSRAYAQAGSLARVAQLRRAHQAALLAGIILLIVLPITLLILELKNAHRNLAQAKQASSEWQHKYQEREQAARDLMNKIQTRERQAFEQRDQLAARLKREREERIVNKTAGNQAVVPIFALSVARSSNADLSRPVNRITLSPSSKLIILLLRLDLEPDLQSYRAALSTADGRSIWRRNRLNPTSKDALPLSFNSSLFKQGNYLLTLEGLTAQRRYVPIAHYTFHVRTQ